VNTIVAVLVEPHKPNLWQCGGALFAITMRNECDWHLLLRVPTARQVSYQKVNTDLLLHAYSIYLTSDLLTLISPSIFPFPNFSHFSSLDVTSIMSLPDASGLLEKRVLESIAAVPAPEAVLCKAANTNGIKRKDFLPNGHSEVDSKLGEKTDSAASVSSKAAEAYSILEQPNRSGRKVKVIVIGAGASALNFAHDIDTSPLDIELAVYEKNSEIGGTWFENK
jgi:hypothetical protein